MSTAEHAPQQGNTERAGGQKARRAADTLPPGFPGGPAFLLQLQRTAGNAAVHALLQRATPSPSGAIIQRNNFTPLAVDDQTRPRIAATLQAWFTYAQEAEQCLPPNDPMRAQLAQTRGRCTSILSSLHRGDLVRVAQQGGAIQAAMLYADGLGPHRRINDIVTNPHNIYPPGNAAAIRGAGSYLIGLASTESAEQGKGLKLSPTTDENRKFYEQRGFVADPQDSKLMILEPGKFRPAKQ